MSLPQAVILAGGLGLRLGVLAEGLPKPMVPVEGRPFLERVVAQLAAQGFEEILLLVGFRAEVIQDHFRDGEAWGLRIRYSREESPLGTGGALKAARPLLGERFLLLFGDLHREFDYAAFCRRHPGDCLAVYPYSAGLNTIACGNVDFDPESGRIRAYRKNDSAGGLGWVDAGFGVFRSTHLAALPEGPCSWEELAYPRMAEGGDLVGEAVDRRFFDIGNPEDLARTRQRLSVEEP
ncbi:MAG TPA: sugar phosphate nucleotidyltransferase [Holophagaceae bacterium]|nr:sugar phosphate nucleotidyltransferase [Holophagaceae bacterium]